MCLQGLDSTGLVRVADGDQLVRVAPSTTRQPDYFAETTEFRPNVPEGFRVQVQKGDAEKRISELNKFQTKVQTLERFVDLLLQLSFTFHF